MLLDSSLCEGQFFFLSDFILNNELENILILFFQTCAPAMSHIIYCSYNNK